MATTTGSPEQGRIPDFGRAFRFFFEDPDWVKKILIGGAFSLLSMFLIGVFFVTGYALRLLRRTARGDACPLPEWDDLGGVFADGLGPVGLYLVHVLPVALVPVSLGCVIGLLSGLSSRSNASEALVPLFALGTLAFYAFLIVAMLALALYFPAVLIRYAVTGRFGVCLEFRENVAVIQRNVVGYIVALVVYLVANFLSQFGILLLCIGIFPVTFWSMCVGAWALGEVARLDPELPSAR